MVNKKYYQVYFFPDYQPDEKHQVWIPWKQSEMFDTLEESKKSKDKIVGIYGVKMRIYFIDTTYTKVEEE